MPLLGLIVRLDDIVSTGQDVIPSTRHFLIRKSGQFCGGGPIAKTTSDQST
jgi:hypothetical protein